MRRAVIVLVLAATLMAGGPAGVGAFPSTYPAGPGCHTHEQPMCPIQQGHGTSRGDFNGDGWDDLALGVPFEDVGDLASAGVVTVIPGGSAGLRFAAAMTWDDADLGDVVESDARTIEGSPCCATSDGNAQGEPDMVGHALAAGDFNGDGADDLAIGVPGQDVGGVTDAGAVRVVYGSRTSGLTPARVQTLTQGDALQSVREGYDHFGETLAAGDVNGDGRDDLVIGVPDENLGNAPDAGAVHVLWGASFGVSRDDDVLLTDPDVEAFDQFGQVLATGDLGLERRYAEVVVGVPSEDHSGYEDAGAVQVWYGYAGGVANFRQPWRVDGDWLRGRLNNYASLGASLALGDFDGNGHGDLAIGAPRELDTASGCSNRCDGAVYVISGDEYGLAPSAARRWTATAAGIGYTFQDWFGASLAAGDFTGDRRDELAIGLPFADRGAEDGGAVRVLRGSANGLTATGGITLDQNWAGGNHIENGDRFGRVLLAANVAGETQADLVVGVPYEDLGDRWDAGAVDVIFGGAAILSGRGQRFTQAAIGLAIEHGDQFGLVAN